MVGIITQSSSFNSFSSICYCFVAMGIHSYSSYKAVKRQKDAITKAWPGGGGTPSEATLLLGSTIVSLLMMPFFCITCFIKVGNLANDGVKLGRDHALGYMLDATPDINDKHEGLRRVWRHFCPLSQTLHLVAAFLLLIPETLLTAVEVKFGYRSSDASWSSNLNFLYSPDRSILSEIRSSVNMSLYANLTHIMLPTPRVPTAGWNDNTAVTTAFMNFCFALACFLVRYSSVFWYTNKVLTVIFALQLLAMTMNSVFSFNTFTVLYCICYNRKLYPNVSLSLSCAMDLFLYLAGGLVLLLSTMTVFEYGAHYFQEKFKIVDSSHHKESSQKHTAAFNTGCQGYIPHSCAVASLIILAMCKGPLLYDLVSLMRVTDDQLLLSGIVCEVSYMVTWVALWFGLTIKQQWHFRILDCVPLHAVCGQDIVKYRQQGHVDKVHNDGQSRGRRLSGKDFPGRYNIEVVPPGTASSSEDNYQAGFGIHEPPMFNIINYAAEIVLDLDSNTTSDDNFNFRKSRSRKDGEQRVTFDESAHGKCSFGKETQHTPTSSLTRQGTVGGYIKDDNHFNVTVDVHNSTPSSTNCSSESSQDITLRQNLNSTDNTEYRNNIRSKCGEFYSSGNNISSNFEEAVMILPSQETVPTLMSSFRDKVRESSLAASSFKERERHMLESFDYTDPLPPPIVEDLQSNDHGNPQCVIDHPGDCTGEFGYPQRSGNTAYAIDKVINDENYTGEYNIDGNSMYGHANSGPDSYSRSNNTNVIYRCDENINHGRYNSTSNDRSSSLPRNKQHTGPSHGSRAHLSSFVSGNAETLGLNPPSVVEDHQLGRASDCVEYHYPPRPQQTVMSGKLKPCMLLHPKIYDWPVLVVMDKRTEIGRRDSANYSLTSSNDSDNCQSLCNQV